MGIVWGATNGLGPNHPVAKGTRHSNWRDCVSVAVHLPNSQHGFWRRTHPASSVHGFREDPRGFGRGHTFGLGHRCGLGRQEKGPTKGRIVAGSLGSWNIPELAPAIQVTP